MTTLEIRSTKEIRMMKARHWSLVIGRWSLVIGLLVAALIHSDSTVKASGEQFPLIGHDLQIDVDSRWAGCGQGGIARCG